MAVTYTPIATQTLSSSALSVTFSSIPGTYTDLILVMRAKSTQSGSAANGARSTINGDSGTNYSEVVIYGDGSSAGSYRAANQAYFIAGDLPQTSNTAWAANVSHFLNYSNTTTYKTIITRCNLSTVVASAYSSIWRNTNAITSITITRDGTNNIASGSIFTLYGIAAA